jgi:TolB-like protein/Flp pilus assembly protein TadD
MRAAGEPSKDVSPSDSAGQQAIREHLETVLASPILASSPRRAQLLRYLCNRALDGQGEPVNEYAIGVDVFEKPASFDPRIDSIVRTEMGRLRQRLKDYYSSVAPSSPIRIELPLRSYVPAFITITADDEAPAAPPLVSSQKVPPRNRMLWVAAIMAVVLLAGFMVWKSRGKTANPAPDTTVAVLPFLNLTGDAGKEYLGDSLTDELTESLAESSNMRVVARTSAFQFKGKNQDIREIGRALNAGALLEGSISQRERKFRIVVQLIRAADGYHLWSRSYDATPANLSQVETEIAASTEQALLPDRKTEARLAFSPNPEAHDLYLRAIYQLQLHTADSLKESLRLAREAVRIDPQYARAHFAVARAANTLSAISVISGREAADIGRPAARQALAIDPQFSDAHAYLALLTYVYDWDWPEAEKEFSLAFQKEGSHGQAHSWYGWALMTRQRFDEARTHLETAEELDPQSPNPRQNMVTDLIFERKLPAARREVEGIFKLYPKSLVAIRDVGWIAILENDCGAARSAALTAAEWYPEQADRTGSPALKAHCGQPEEARRQLEAMVKNSEKEFVSFLSIAQGYASLHDADRAIEALEKSAATRESSVLYIAIDTLFDPVRKDPRFIALERKIGLP